MKTNKILSGCIVVSAFILLALLILTSVNLYALSKEDKHDVAVFEKEINAGNIADIFRRWNMIEASLKNNNNLYAINHPIEMQQISEVLPDNIETDEITEYYQRYATLWREEQDRYQELMQDHWFLSYGENLEQ